MRSGGCTVSSDLGDFAAAQTARADPQRGMTLTDHGANFVQVRLPGPARLIVRVADVVARHSALAADIAGTCHGTNPFLSVLDAVSDPETAGERPQDG